MKLNSPEYLALREFYANLRSLLHPEPRPPELDPIFNLERLEREFPSKAVPGLQMAVGDVLERTLPWPKERIQECDAILRSRNCLTLSEVRLRRSKRLPRLLKAKRIRTEVDYYFLKSLSDSATLLDGDQMAIVSEMLTEFENRHVRKFRRTPKGSS